MASALRNRQEGRESHSLQAAEVLSFVEVIILLNKKHRANVKIKAQEVRAKSLTLPASVILFSQERPTSCVFVFI